MKPENVKDLAGNIKDELKFDEEVKGLDFDQDVTLESLIRSYSSTGFQAANLAKGIAEIRRMEEVGAKIFMGCTSNIISSGMREHIKFLAKNKKIDVLVCTAGGIEEDLIKCFKPTYVGEFNLNGKELRENGWNRVGNLVINNNNYECFEKWFIDILDEMVSGRTDEFPFHEQCPDGFTTANPLITTPSQFISFLGKKINNEDSILYWCYKNGIKVYSPALTDGSIGDMLTFYKKRSIIKLDIVEDIYNVNTEGFGDHKNGAIIVGCGLVKHHILNANLFCGGLDYCVLLNTANEYDGSDSGANLNEAYSWGKVKPDGTCVKIHGEASIILPLLIYGAYKSKIN